MVASIADRDMPLRAMIDVARFVRDAKRDSREVAAGLDDLALSRIMGHGSATITRDVYGHMREDRIAEVTKTLDAYYEEANRA